MTTSDVPESEDERARAEAHAWGSRRHEPFDSGRHYLWMTVAAVVAGVAAFLAKEVLVVGAATAVLFPWSLYVVVRSAVESAAGSRLDGIGAELAKIREALRDAKAGDPSGR